VWFAFSGSISISCSREMRHQRRNGAGKYVESDFKRTCDGAQQMFIWPGTSLAQELSSQIDRDPPPRRLSRSSDEEALILR
jgi:hypothetical protein